MWRNLKSRQKKRILDKISQKFGNKNKKNKKSKQFSNKVDALIEEMINECKYDEFSKNEGGNLEDSEFGRKAILFSYEPNPKSGSRLKSRPSLDSDLEKASKFGRKRLPSIDCNTTQDTLKIKNDSKPDFEIKNVGPILTNSTLSLSNDFENTSDCEENYPGKVMVNKSVNAMSNYKQWLSYEKALKKAEKEKCYCYNPRALLEPVENAISILSSTAKNSHDKPILGQREILTPIPLKSALKAPKIKIRSLNRLDEGSDSPHVHFVESQIKESKICKSPKLLSAKNRNCSPKIKSKSESNSKSEYKFKSKSVERSSKPSMEKNFRLNSGKTPKRMKPTKLS